METKSSLEASEAERKTFGKFQYGQGNIRKEPTKCILCGELAFYQANYKGYCKNHKLQAIAAMRLLTAVQLQRTTWEPKWLKAIYS